MVRPPADFFQSLAVSFSSHAAAAIALRGGGRGGLGPAIVGDADWRRARAPARAAWIGRVREKGSHALRADELVLGPSLAAFVRRLLRPAADDE